MIFFFPKSTKLSQSAKCAEGDRGLHKLKRNDMYYVCHPRGVMIGMCPANMVTLYREKKKLIKNINEFYFCIQNFCEASQRCIKREGKPAKTIKVYDESENCHVRIPSCKGIGKYQVWIAY